MAWNRPSLNFTKWIVNRALNQRYPALHHHLSTSISLETPLKIQTHSDLRLKKAERKGNIWSCPKNCEIWFKQSQADSFLSFLGPSFALPVVTKVWNLHVRPQWVTYKKTQQLAKSTGCDPKYQKPGNTRQDTNTEGERAGNCQCIRVRMHISGLG